MRGIFVENRKAEILMAAMLLTFVFLISRHAGLMVSGQNVTAGKKTTSGSS